MSSHIAVRMCPECRTTDANFPNIDGCKSCATMVAHEEAIFWNTPMYLEPQFNERGESIGNISMTPKDIMRMVRVPWYITVIRMLMLE